MPYTIEDAVALAAEAVKLAERAGDAALTTKTELGGFSALMLARACQSLAATSVLARQGLNGDAMSAGRTLTELMIDYGYIALDPAKRIKMFTEYDHIPKYEMALAINELHGGALDPAAMQILKDRHDKAQLNNPNPKQRYSNWAALSIRQRAIEGDRKQAYSLPYADACSASHSGYGTLEYALAGLNTKNPSIRFTAPPPDEKPVDLAFSSMIMLIASVIDACKLDQSLADGLTQLGDRRKTFTAKT